MTISSLKSFLLTPAKKDFHTAISTVAATTIEIVPGQRRTKDLNHHCHHRHLHATRRFFSSGNIDDHNNNDLCDPKSPIAHKSKLKLNYFRGWAYQQVYLNRRINHKRQQQSPGDSDHTVRNRTESVTSDDDSNNGHDRDRILFFEHDPVYTLGRGADENHLTFLDEKNRHLLSRRRPSQRPHSNSGANEGAVGDREQRQRQGQNSRLYVDKFKNNQNCYGLSVEEEVDSIGTLRNSNIQQETASFITLPHYFENHYEKRYIVFHCLTFVMLSLVSIYKTIVHSPIQMNRNQFYHRMVLQFTELKEVVRLTDKI